MLQVDFKDFSCTWKSFSCNLRFYWISKTAGVADRLHRFLVAPRNISVVFYAKRTHWPFRKMATGSHVMWICGANATCRAVKSVQLCPNKVLIISLIDPVQSPFYDKVHGCTLWYIPETGRVLVVANRDSTFEAFVTAALDLFQRARQTQYHKWYGDMHTIEQAR